MRPELKNESTVFVLSSCKPKLAKTNDRAEATGFCIRQPPKRISQYSGFWCVLNRRWVSTGCLGLRTDPLYKTARTGTCSRYRLAQRMGRLKEGFSRYETKRGVRRARLTALGGCQTTGSSGYEYNLFETPTEPAFQI